MSLLKVNEIQIFNGETVTITAPAVVSANDNTNAALRITQTGTGNALVVEDAANPDSTPFVVDANGNVGIGTTSPSAQLDLSNNNTLGSALNILRFTDTDITAAADQPSGKIEFYTSDTSSAGVGSAITGLAGIGGTGSAKLAFEVNGAERMRIDNSGNVGIGTTSPSQKLDVTGNINATGALTLGTALAVAEGGTGATDAATARTNLDVDQAGTDNSTDVTLVTTSHDYLSVTGQAITLGPIDLAADVTGSLPYASISGTPTLGTAAAEDVGYFATAAQGTLADSAVQPGDDANTLGSGAATDGYVLTADGAGGTAWEAASGGGASLPIDLLSSGASIRKSDGTTAVLSESSGVVTLENVTIGSGATFPAGVIRNSVFNSYSTSVGVVTTAYTATGLQITITPTSTDSDIFLIFSQQYLGEDLSGGNWSFQYKITRTISGTETDIFEQNYQALYHSADRNDDVVTFTYKDSPSTTSAVTYKIYGKDAVYGGDLTFQNDSSTSTAMAFEVL